MLQKLTEEQRLSILECATDAFGRNGLERTTVSSIAREAGVSVGVIYKYYRNKEDLFRACLSRSLTMLGDVLRDAVADGGSCGDSMAKLIHAARIYAEAHPSHIRMYHAITVRSDDGRAAEYAREIESVSADVYKKMFSRAKAQDEVHTDMNPRAFAFFFDNLLMMLHFSYGCDYYRERMKIFLGEEADGDQLEKELMKFLRSAAGIE